MFTSSQHPEMHSADGSCRIEHPGVRRWDVIWKGVWNAETPTREDARKFIRARKPRNPCSTPREICSQGFER